MAGAAGDALGYEVEFMSCRSILSRFGENGITKFALDSNGKALISDDTQMTLFTANGMLMGLTRGYMRGIGGRPEKYVDIAYLDWYYTQTGKKREMLIDDWHPTWLRDLPEMAYRRAPGNTCLTACKSLFENKEVQNNSMGCGGIMRVAPIALIASNYEARGKGMYTIEGIARGGAAIAEWTHKHPLGYIPSAALAVLLYTIVPLSVNEVCEQIDQIVAETVEVVDRAYTEGGEERAKIQFKEVTNKVMRLAHSNISDEEAIKQLGEGWVALEAWAIALYCAVRHIDSVEDAIIAAVNHDGDSDSTGSICGNIMGVIYGYEHIKERNIFCPEGAELEQTLELSEVILALADDLSSECPIGEYMQIERPEQIQWLLRYCEMEPAGIGENR
jgi:ADP-ribosylglycohydrolase